MKLNEKELAIEVSNAINNITFNNRLFVEQMSKEHRALQQNFTQLCLAWLIECRDQKVAKRYDARNESGCNTAKKLMDFHESAIFKEEKIYILIHASTIDCNLKVTTKPFFSYAQAHRAWWEEVSIDKRDIENKDCFIIDEKQDYYDAYEKGNAAETEVCIFIQKYDLKDIY